MLDPQRLRTDIEAVAARLAARQFVLDVAAFRALEEYRIRSGDFADYLIGWRNRKAGCEKTVSFDLDLKDCDLFKVL